MPTSTAKVDADKDESSDVFLNVVLPILIVAAFVLISAGILYYLKVKKDMNIFRKLKEYKLSAAEEMESVKYEKKNDLLIYQKWRNKLKKGVILFVSIYKQWFKPVSF